MKILLVTPPLTQLNTTFPATTQLVGFLRSQKLEAEQMDLSIGLIEALFTRSKLEEVFEKASQHEKLSKQNKIILQQADFYIRAIEPVMRFLSGKDNSLAQRFCNLDFWPVSKRFPTADDLE